MTNPIESLKANAEAVSRTENMLQQLELAKSDAHRLVEEINQLRGASYEGTDEAGGVTCTVNGEGRVVAVAISARAMQSHDNEALARAVLEAYRSASASMAADLEEQLASRLGMTLSTEASSGYDFDEAFRTAMKRVNP